MEPARHCMMCDRPDNVDNIVQCDKCDGYVHFSCAEVGDSIADADRSFTCRRCAESEEAISVSSHRSSRRSHTTSGSNISATRLRLRLQQLETERQNRLKELEDAERFQRLRRQVDSDFEKQRFEALEAQLLEEEENCSVRSRVSSKIIRENTDRWIGASRTEGQVASTSTTAVTNTALTGPAIRSRSGSARNSLIGSVEANVVRTNSLEEPVFTSTSEIILQNSEMNNEPVGNRQPLQVSTNNATGQQEVVPVVIGSQIDREAQPTLGTKKTPAISSSDNLMYRVTNMGSTSVHYGIPITSSQSAVNQVRKTCSISKVGLQPVVEVVQSSTSRESLVVPISNPCNQLRTISSVDNHSKSACLQNTCQGNFSQSTLPHTTPYDGEPHPGSHTPVAMLPTGSNQLIKPKSSVLLPPSGHKQAIESNPSVLPQVPKPHSSMSLPPPGERQNSVPNLPLSMQQVCCGKRTQWDQSMIQPSGYESFMRKPSMPPICSTHLGSTILNVQPLPVGQSQQFVPNTWPSVPHETIPGSQQQQGANLYRHPQQSEVSRGFQREQLTGLNQLAESEPPSVVPQTGNRYLEEDLLHSEQPRFSTSNSTLLLPTSRHQQHQIPSSSVFVPTLGQQQSQVPSSTVLEPPSGYQRVRASNPVASVHPPGPEQPSAFGNPNIQSVPTQQNVLDRARPRHGTGPTAEQLAARQVIPRELPVFSGNPQDWPLFLSSFRNSTEACGYNDAENLARLQQYLRGPALDSVRCRLLIPESVPHVMATLQRLYGRPEIIIYSLLKRMREIPSPRDNHLKTLIEFGMGVENLVGHMILADQQQHINNPMLLQELVDRLPPSLKLQWASYKRSHYNVNLATFNDFMAELVTLASDVTLLVDPGTQSFGKYEKVTRENSTKEKLFVHQQPSTAPEPAEISTDQNEVISPVSKPCLYCDKSEHRIAECPDFKKLNMDERWKVMRQKGMCRLCLIPHRSWPCRSKQECGIGDCRMRHHPLMHPTEPGSNTRSNSPPASTSTNRNVSHQHHHSQTSSALLRYLPVTLYGNGKSVDVYAFLDDGSSSTMLEMEVARLLGAKGPNEPLHLHWTGDVKRIEKGSQRIELAISGRSEKTFPLKARTVEHLKLPSQTVDYEELCEVYPHLRKLPMCGYAGVTPQLIIGVDNAKLISTLKSRESSTGDLIAAKTRLGWCIYGRHTSESGLVEYVNAHVEQCEADPHDASKQFLAVDETSFVISLQTEKVWTGPEQRGAHFQGDDQSQMLTTNLELLDVRGRSAKSEEGLLERTGTTRVGECWRTHCAVAVGYEVSPGDAAYNDAMKQKQQI